MKEGVIQIVLYRKSIQASIALSQKPCEGYVCGELTEAPRARCQRTRQLPLHVLSCHCPLLINTHCEKEEGPTEGIVVSL